MLLERRVSGGGGKSVVSSSNLQFPRSFLALGLDAMSSCLGGGGGEDMLWAIGLVVVVTAPVEAPAVLFGFW
ncbi:hypothetical protein F2Q70_00035561 [Brassica cretica]|uniref:Uncharacterized protein n=1 Tax=Brassica cretica TaxID=69181 RepID=A0A8S9JVV2_BRACR|nr:hypothetical protein F2Q70_00035561 [Brassica cretica]KAF3601260.1 hypothetical protein F2Q69_00034817 [Brassica cretica]